MEKISFHLLSVHSSMTNITYERLLQHFSYMCKSSNVYILSPTPSLTRHFQHMHSVSFPMYQTEIEHFLSRSDWVVQIGLGWARCVYSVNKHHVPISFRYLIGIGRVWYKWTLITPGKHSFNNALAPNGTLILLVGIYSYSRSLIIEIQLVRIKQIARAGIHQRSYF